MHTSDVDADPERVLVREVGPRDGFQNEREIVPTDEKVRLIEMLGSTGVPRLELTSFVRADVIPQLADAAEVLARVALPPGGVARSVLVPNERGLEAALGHRAAFDEVNGFDPAYFMFVEDVDLCARLAKTGWRVMFAPVAEVTHAVGASVSRRRFRMVVEHARSLDRFFARRYVKPWQRAVRPLIRLGLLGWVVAVLAWSALRGRTHAQG